MLNRTALVVRPAPPFVAWAASLDDAGTVPDVDGEQTVYLVPPFDDDADAQRVLKIVYARIFEQELFDWYTDETRWPQKRTLALFRQWFTLEWHTVIEDLCDFAIADDDEND